MKTIRKILHISLMIMLFTSCSKDDDAPLANRSPENFNLISITDEATGINLNPTFNWQTATDPDGDTVTYDLLLGNDSDNLQNIASGLNTTSYTIEEKLPLIEKLYWKVIAKDTKGGTTESEVYTFTTRNLIFTKVVDAAIFSARQSPTLTTFDDQLWIIAGFDGGLKRDIWRSSDGLNWAGRPVDANFLGRNRHASVAYNGKLWVFGGAGTTKMNDVWSSDNGLDWTLINQTAPFTPRDRHTVVVFQNQMWLIGGLDQAGNRSNSIISTSNGTVWSPSFATVPFKRSSHACVVFKDKIWVIGGHDGTSLKNDVWSSSNGIGWQEVTPAAAFSHRTEHRVEVYDNKMWLIGGHDGTSVKNDVWSSDDGITWVKVPTSARFSQRTFHATTVFDNKIWIFGGNSGDLEDDLWVMD